MKRELNTQKNIKAESFKMAKKQKMRQTFTNP